MPRPYRPLAFGNRFILKSQDSGIEHMKLQKLVYLAYGWWLGFDKAPILDEQPQVWKLGPVFNSMYFALNHYGSRPIFHMQRDRPIGPMPEIDEDDADADSLVDWIINRYGMRGSFYLSDLTHKPGSPWYQTAAKYSFSVPKNMPIPVDVIQEHYRRLAKDNGLA